MNLRVHSPGRELSCSTSGGTDFQVVPTRRAALNPTIKARSVRFSESSTSSGSSPSDTTHRCRRNPFEHSVRQSTFDCYGIGGEAAISKMATSIKTPLSATSPIRIRRNRKWPLIPIRNKIVAR